MDNAITLDSYGQAIDDVYSRTQSEFIIVSGDRDLQSMVSKIADRRVRVHVWSWNNALASVYTRMQNELVHVHLRDDYLDEIGFCDTNFRVDRSVISPHSIVILDPLPKGAEIDKFISTLRIPIYRYEYARQRVDVSSQDLVIIPAYARSMKHGEHVTLFQTVQIQLAPHGLSVLTFSEYTQRHLTDAPEDELKISPRFGELPRQEVEDGGDKDEGGQDIGGDGSDNDGFAEVNYRSEQRRKQLKANEYKSGARCKWGKYCLNECDCKYGHTKEEEQYFLTYHHKVAKKYRYCTSKDCTWGAKCKYAHSEDELLVPLAIGLARDILWTIAH